MVTNFSHERWQLSSGLNVPLASSLHSRILGFRWRPSFKAFRRNTRLLSHFRSFPQLLYQPWPALDLALATERKALLSKTLAILFHLKLILKAIINLDGSIATRTPKLEILIVAPLV